MVIVNMKILDISMKIYFYIAENLEKILLRKLYKPMYILELNDYECELSKIQLCTHEKSTLNRLTENYKDKIEYKNTELEKLRHDIKSCITLNYEFEKNSTLLSWLDISAESAYAHKKNLYITGRDKKLV